MSFTTKLLTAGFVLAAFLTASAEAQQVVTYYSSPNAYSVQQVTVPAPVVTYRPVVVAPTPVYVQRPVIAPAPIYAPQTVVVQRPIMQPVAVTAYRPVAASVPVTSYVPVPVTTTRYRPILGGTVQRTRVHYAPVTTYVVP
jgi:hypothetical protein